MIGQPIKQCYYLYSTLERWQEGRKLVNDAHNQMRTKKVSSKIYMGMNGNISKTKVLNLNGNVNSPRLLWSEDIATVVQLCYLGSVIITDGAAGSVVNLDFEL